MYIDCLRFQAGSVDNISLLKKFNEFLEAGECPVNKIYRSVSYNDEPAFYQYNTLFGSSLSKNGSETVWGGGISLSRSLAQIKAIAEGLERYCLSLHKSPSIISPIKDLKSVFLHPSNVVGPTGSQLKDARYKDFEFNDNSSFGWINGYSLKNKKSNRVLIPAQLVSVPYLYSKSEPVIRSPISTGAAFGTSVDKAIISGIYEVIERDALMIFYLNRLKPMEISLIKSGGIWKKINYYFKRYKLDLRVFDITTDIGIPVVLALILDGSSLGPTVSLGLKAGSSIDECVIGSICEAQHTRPWMRDEKAKISEKDYIEILKNPRKISSVVERGMYWFEKDPYELLDFWLKDTTVCKIIQEIKYSKGLSKLGKILDIFENMGNQIYYINLTPRNFAKWGFFTVKVIIPQLHPLYLEESNPLFGGDRIREVPRRIGLCKYLCTESDFNPIPHPFL